MLLPQVSSSEATLDQDLPSSLIAATPHPSASESQATSNEDEDLWLCATAPILFRLLDHANYNSQSKSWYRSFYSQSIVPALGPRPQPTNIPFWRSFMTDDHSPIEYSWNFTAQQETTVRFAIEPINSLAGSAKDPFNQIAPGKFLEQIALLNPEVDLTWYYTFAEAFYVEPGITERTGQRLPTTSQAFVGFDLNRQGKLLPKVYMMPTVKAAQTGLSPGEIVLTALQRLELQGANILTAWNVVQDYIRSKPTGSEPTVEMVSFDCIHPRSHSSRIKIYVRSPHMSLSVAKDMYTLGGRIVGDDTAKSLEALEQLWRLSLNVAPDVGENKEIPPRNERHANHRTGGVIFNYELTPGSAVPEPKLYIPVRHYAPNDRAISEGIAAFFRWQEWNRHSESYLEAIQDIFSDHPLDTTTGTQTYISFSYKKKQGAYVSVYYSPRIF
ncbi:aromatic prenyltransferase [Aspergillus crustosus]